MDNILIVSLVYQGITLFCVEVLKVKMVFNINKPLKYQSTDN